MSPVFLRPLGLRLGTKQIDEVIEGIVSSLVNVKFTKESWEQASLPVSLGGVGIRSNRVLSPSAFLANVHASTAMVNLLLQERVAFRQTLPLKQQLACGKAWKVLPFRRFRNVVPNALGTTGYVPQSPPNSCRRLILLVVPDYWPLPHLIQVHGSTLFLAAT